MMDKFLSWFGLVRLGDLIHARQTVDLLIAQLNDVEEERDALRAELNTELEQSVDMHDYTALHDGELNVLSGMVDDVIARSNV